MKHRILFRDKTVSGRMKICDKIIKIKTTNGKNRRIRRHEIVEITKLPELK